MKRNQSQSKWQRLKVPAVACAAACAMFVLFAGAMVWLKLKTLEVQTVSARLTSEGNVIWNHDHVDINAFQPKLQSSADVLRSNGFKPRLLIEYYSDTSATDVEKLERLGHDAGFDVVDTLAHDWSSPKTVQERD